MTAALTLPGGRSLALDDSVRAGLSAGVLVCEGVSVREEPAVWSETAELAARLREDHAGRLPSEIPGLREARDLYKAFGMEPTRHRPSSEALLRRVLRGKDLYRISNAVDCCNLASLSFLLPIGMYDLDLVEGDVVLRTGREGEQYPGIRKGPVHLAGRLGLFDAAGGFGSPTSDSLRTSVRDATTSLLAVIMATASYPRNPMRANVSLLADLFTRHCEGRVTFTALLPEN